MPFRPVEGAPPRGSVAVGDASQPSSAAAALRDSLSFSLADLKIFSLPLAFYGSRYVVCESTFLFLSGFPELLKPMAWFSHFHKFPATPRRQRLPPFCSPLRTAIRRTTEPINLSTLPVSSLHPSFHPVSLCDAFWKVSSDLYPVH